jgi:hypothetical protein
MENETLKRFVAATGEARKLIADGYTDVQVCLTTGDRFIHTATTVADEPATIILTAKKEF